MAAISALIPAARMIAAKIATNPAVQEFGKDVLKNAAGMAVDAAATRLTRSLGSGFVPPEGLTRRTSARADGLPLQQKDATQMRRSGATQALATLKAVQERPLSSAEMTQGLNENE